MRPSDSGQLAHSCHHARLQFEAQSVELIQRQPDRQDSMTGVKVIPVVSGHFPVTLIPQVRARVRREYGAEGNVNFGLFDEAAQPIEVFFSEVGLDEQARPDPDAVVLEYVDGTTIHICRAAFTHSYQPAIISALQPDEDITQPSLFPQAMGV